MRRHLAATAVLGTTLFLAAACSGDADSSSTTTATTTATTGPTPATGSSAAAGGGTTTTVDPKAAASGDAALAGNTKAICDQAARTSTQFGETFIADLKLQIEAAGKGTEAKAQAQQKVDRDVQNYSYALTDMAKLTTDPALKKALTDMSTEVKALKGDVTKLNAEKMSELTATLDKACGKG